MKYLEETSLIITDLITETIILFVALFIILNYYVSKDKENNLCDIGTNDSANDSAKNTLDKGDPWELLKSIIGENVDTVIDVLKTCTNSFISFSFYILLLYIYFYSIRPSKKISFPRHNFDRNIKFIFEDFTNKLAFILLFPILFISIFSLMFVSIKIMFEFPRKADMAGLNLNILLQMVMFFWFILLFYVLGYMLYLLILGNISKLIKNMGSNVMMYLFAFSLMIIIFFAGFYKLLLFVLTTIFLLNPKDIKTKLYEKEMFPLYFIIQFALSFTLLMNIKQLFPFELWIFGIVIFILFFVLLAKAYYDNYNK